MAQWNGSTESGILRKNIPSENHDDLLVFGYACKLFRDDEKALFIDQGKHLIPWMGDETLKIDRYDGRGALSDLTKYEASREGYDATRWMGLSEKERNIEELCDKERYYSLNINEEEEQMYKEEELKRQNTNAIQYSYDVPQNPEVKTDGVPTVPEAEEEYKPPPTLDVPIDIEWPKTVKENARIEKTALFVCRQGPQMEILIKAKQEDNPQFSFLYQDDKLYKFYRHVLSAFKNGRYQGYRAHSKTNSEQQTENSDQDSGSHYLHPSLTSSSAEPAASTAITIPQIAYKPSVNCAYSQLVNRIQGNQSETQEAAAAKVPDYTQMTYEQQQYYQYYYVQQYYEYYKQLAMFQQGQGGNPGQFVPPTDFQNLDPAIQHYIQQLAYSQYIQQHQQSSYAQIVSNVNKESNPYAANVPQLPQNLPEDTKNSKNSKQPEDERTVTYDVKKPILSLTAYGSGTDSESEDSSDEDDKSEERIVTASKPDYSVPTGETQIVIDKMALYVSQNGDQFEEIVKAKNDPRFEFLLESHEFNKYYKEKVRQSKGESTEDDKKSEDVKVVKEEVKAVKKPKKEKKVIAPVCFSIKKPKEDQPKEIKSALPIEESDDEEETTTAANPTTTTTTTTTTTSSTPAMPPNIVYSLANTPASLTSVLIKMAENQKRASEKSVENPQEKLEVTKKEEPQIKKQAKETTVVIDDEDPILEMIELTEDIEEKKDAKRAEDKIKDKLAAAAREKLASVTRDRALQMERKKKAAAFLKLKSVATNQQTENVPEKVEKPDSPEKPATPIRRDSIEIIEIDSEEPSPKKKKHKKDKDRIIDVDRSRSRSRERVRKKEKKKERDKDRTRRRSPSSEEEENRRRKDDDKREKKKKHKRKHSKTHREKSKKKLKRRHKKSETESSDSTDSRS